MIDPRRRALEQIASGMLPDTSEVDVDEIPVPAQRVAMPAGLADDAPVTLESLTPTQVATERDYYGEALEAQRHARLGSTIEGFGSGIIEAITGVGPSGEQIQARKDRVAEPMAQYLQRQKLADDARRLELAGMKAAPKPPVAGRVPKSTDPASPESKRAQGIIRATLGDQYAEEEIARMTEADADAVLKYGSMRRGAEVTREGHLAATQRADADRAQRAQIWAEQRGLKWAEMDQDERLAAMRLADSKAAREEAAKERATKTERDLSERNVGGFEIDPQNPPSPEASSKMAETKIAYDRVKEQLGRLDSMLKAHGSELVGPNAGEMGVVWSDLTTALRLFDRMGVPNANDYVILAKSVVDPTSEEGAKTSTSRMRAQLREVQRKMELALRATAAAYKFRPIQQARAVPPKAQSASTALPKDASGQPTLEAPPPPSAGKVRVREKATGRMKDLAPDVAAKVLTDPAYERVAP